MAAYQTFTSTRFTEPDLPTLVAQLRAVDTTIGIGPRLGGGPFVVKKTTAWTTQQITAAQTVIDTAPATSDQLTAQALIDAMPIYDRARDAVIVDQFNVIRARLPTPLPDITAQQVITAIRNKAGQL